MEGAGMSIFKGAASIHLNNSDQDRLNELEELEDEKRRIVELGQDLHNAFDDLDGDEEVSGNSSGNFTLDSSHANKKHHNRSGLPPTYTESLNHLADAMSGPASPMCHEEHLKLSHSPYGGGDCQNNYFQQDHKGHVNGFHNIDPQKMYVNHENLKTLAAIRVKECETYAAQIQKLDSEIDSLRVRLSDCQHDKDRAELSLKESHRLLAMSKHKTHDLEQNLYLLEQKLSESNLKNEQLHLELTTANVSLQDVQQKLVTMQVAHSYDRNALFREQQDRHREEMDMLQNELIKAKNRIEEKDNEIKALEKRYVAIDREKEDILVEKSAKINRLANELEAAQNRLVSGEASKLKDRVFQLTNERNASREQVKELGSKLESTAGELVACRNKLASQHEVETWRSALQQILKDALPDNTYNIGEPSSPGKLATLKEVLNCYKQKIQKLGQLQDEINKRDKRIEQHRKHESELQLKLEERKDIEMQLKSRIAVLQSKLELLGSNSDTELLEEYKQQNERLRQEADDLRTDMKNLELKYTDLEMEYEKLQAVASSRAGAVHEANADLLQELERYSSTMKETLKENGELKTLYLQVCSARDSVTREIKEVRNSIQRERDDFKRQEKEYIERVENEKKHVEKLTAELSNAKQELERANKRITELHTEFTDKQKEFTDKLNKFLEDEKCAMRKEMEGCIQCENQLKHIKYLEDKLNKCNVRLASQEGNEDLMKELKGKAEFFQNYIMERFKQIQDQRSVASENTNEKCGDAAESALPRGQTCDDGIAAKTELMMKEKAIREQIAEKFTLEMKTMEMNCARRLKEMETDQLTSVSKLKDLLERKAKEVDTLKEFILSERAKVTQILELKENEISDLIKEHNKLQAEYQSGKDDAVSWRHKAEQYRERLSRFSSFENVLKKERDDMKIRSQECSGLKTELCELQSQMSQMEEEYSRLRSEHQIVLDKYKSVKKTVYTYKDYMSKKDNHINNEMNRIQQEYRTIFVKLQNQINNLVNCRIQEERRGASSQHAHQYQPYDCTDKIKKLHEDFARLAQGNFADSVAPL